MFLADNDHIRGQLIDLVYHRMVEFGFLMREGPNRYFCTQDIINLESISIVVKRRLKTSYGICDQEYQKNNSEMYVIERDSVQLDKYLCLYPAINYIGMDKHYKVNIQGSTGCRTYIQPESEEDTKRANWGEMQGHVQKAVYDILRYIELEMVSLLYNNSDRPVIKKGGHGI